MFRELSMRRTPDRRYEQAGQVHPSHSVATRRALRAIAVFEALKGAAALAAGLGFLSVLRHDLRRIAATIVDYFGLEPGAHYPSLFLHYAQVLADANVRAVVLLTVGYVTLRSCEAYGLWHERTWGEWLGALSGALYIPFELHHLMHEPSLLGLGVLSVNVLVVAYLAFVVWNEQREQMR